jgi:hypothetical protein
VVSTRFKLALACGGFVGATILAGFGSAVRHEARQVAGRYGAEIAIERVVPRIGGLKLRGVDVTLADVPSTRIHLDEVDVSLVGDRAVALRGGLISSRGPRDVVMREVEAWRSRRGSGGSGEGGGRPVQVGGLRVEWRNSNTVPTEAVTATGVSVARDGGKVRILAGGASVTLGRTVVDVKNGLVELVRREGSGYRLGALAADRVEAELPLPGSKADVTAVRGSSGATVATPVASARRGDASAAGRRCQRPRFSAGARGEGAPGRRPREDPRGR